MKKQYFLFISREGKILIKKAKNEHQRRIYFDFGENNEYLMFSEICKARCFREAAKIFKRKIAERVML